jgi:DNA-directed RNA polymerase subunit RPC12/RpoP
MPRRRKLDLEAIRASLNIECPHCHETLRPAERMRLDSERLRCLKCKQDFVEHPKSGSPQPGVDVDDRASGTAKEPPMYQLIRQPSPVADRQFEIQFLDAGVEAFSFTFG